MSTNYEKYNGASAVHEQSGSGVQLPVQKVGNVQFSWRLFAQTIPLGGGLLRVQIAVQPEGTHGKPFLSNPVDVALGELATAVFPHTSGGIADDDFTIERFEALPRQGGGRSAVVQFRLLPDATGMQAGTLVIEQTSITIFWLIGVRNIVLVDTDNGFEQNIKSATNEQPH